MTLLDLLREELGLTDTHAIAASAARAPRMSLAAMQRRQSDHDH
jgi:hypothetical protein